MSKAVGFVGLGSIGRPIAAHLAGFAAPLLGYDKAGTAPRLPEGAVEAPGLAAIAAQCELVFTSLPDGNAFRELTAELVGIPNRRVALLVDLSTIGIECAAECAARLQAAGMRYLDCPVSGGVAGARAARLSVMAAGDAEAYASALPFLQRFSARQFHVGPRPGQAQAMKLVNNFLSATALAATSEAMVFGISQGLEMSRMLEVLNASSGRSAATEDKFLNEVATGRFQSGFANALMSKDVSLYLDAAAASGSPVPLAQEVQRIWNEFRQAMPGADFTRIYSFVAGQVAAAAEAEV